MNDGLSQEDEGRANIVCMDESIVHQFHSSAYSYFQRDKKGVVHDGLGRRTSGKSQRMIMVHVIKYCLLESRDNGGRQLVAGSWLNMP